MNITCVICKELFEQNSDIFSTQCGHVFHHNCIVAWLNQKENCPQCREKATLNSKSSYAIHRVFFDINREISHLSVDAAWLQQRVDSLEFDTKLKQKKIDGVSEKCHELQKHNSGLREEVRRLEHKVSDERDTIHVLKEQLKDSKKFKEEKESLTQVVSKLQRSLDELRYVKEMIKSSPERVTEIVSNTVNVRALQSYVIILKKQVEAYGEKMREARGRYKTLQNDLTAVTKHRNLLANKCDKLQNLQERLAISESLNAELEKRLERKTSEMSTNTDEAANRLVKVAKHSLKISEDESKESPIKMPKLCENAANDSLPKSNVFSSFSGNSLTAIKEDEENSPYLQVQGGIASMRMNPLKRSGKPSSGLGVYKKSRVELMPNSNQGPPLSFDGYGGHSREDIMPSPNFRVSKLKSRKPPAHLSKSKKPKQADSRGNATLDNFVDLTDI